MPYAGELMVNLSLNSSLGPSVQKAKGDLGQLDQSVQKSSGQMNVLDAATGKNARGIKSMGTVAMMASGPIMLAGTALRNMGSDTAKIAPMFEMGGLALMGFDSVAAILPPIIKSIGFAHTAIIPAILGHTGALGLNTAATLTNTGVTVAAEAAELEAAAATNLATGSYEARMVVLGALNPSITANAAASLAAAAATESEAVSNLGLNPTLIARGLATTGATVATEGLTVATWGLTAATMALNAIPIVAVFAAVAVATYAIYTAYTAAAKSANDLESATKSLTQSQEELRYVQSAANEQIKAAESVVDGYKSRIKDADSALQELTQDQRDYTQALDESKNAADDLANAQLDIRDANLSVTRARQDYSKAVASGDATEIQSAKLALDRAKQRQKEAKERPAEIKTEKKAADDKLKSLQEEYKVKTPEEIGPAIEKKRLDIIADQATAMQDIILAEQKLNEEKQAGLAIDNEMKKNEFLLMLYKMQQEGKSLDAKSLETFRKGPAWMKEAIESVSPTVTKQPDYLQWAAETMPGGGLVKGVKMAAGHGPETLQPKIEINPVIKNLPEYQGLSPESLVGTTIPSMKPGGITIDNSVTVQAAPGSTREQIISLFESVYAGQKTNLRAQLVQRGY